MCRVYLVVYNGLMMYRICVLNTVGVFADVIWGSVNRPDGRAEILYLLCVVELLDDIRLKRDMDFLFSSRMRTFGGKNV